MPNIRRRLTESAAAVIAAILFVLSAHADVVTKADLQIQGSSLAVVDTIVTTQLGSTAFVHTSFGGLQDDQAPVIEGLSAVGDLTGPGITTPIQIVTAPGHAFQISGLSQEGVYYLQNVRLMNGTQLLQLAVPSAAAIQVANTLKTTVTVRQLTSDEMRARGINVDPSNYDVYGHQVGLLRQDGTYTTTDYDGFGNSHNVDDYAADGTHIGHTGADVTATERLSQVQTDVGGSAGTRTTKYAWNGSGITSNVAATAPSTPATPTTGINRASFANYDPAGRLVASRFGPGTLATPITNPFSSLNVTSYAGGTSDLPTQTSVGERISAPYAQTFDYNTAGDTIRATLAGLSSSQHFDQSGNVTSQTEPNRNEAKYDYDSRGALTKETLPDSKQIAHQTSALGVPTKYTDQVAQATTVTDKDFIGRPLSRGYADGTFEHFEWEGPRIATYTNRQSQKVTYTYYPNGKLFQIIGSVVLDEFRYDVAGRVSMMRTPDAEIDIDSYDKEGHPLHVTEKRIIDGTPSSPLEQTYTWNAHGERTSWTMPRLSTPQTGWTDTVFEDHDEAGNVIGISRTQFGSGTAVTRSDPSRPSATGAENEPPLLKSTVRP